MPKTCWAQCIHSVMHNCTLLATFRLDVHCHLFHPSSDQVCNAEEVDEVFFCLKSNLNKFINNIIYTNTMRPCLMCIWNSFHSFTILTHFSLFFILVLINGVHALVLSYRYGAVLFKYAPHAFTHIHCRVVFGSTGIFVLVFFCFFLVFAFNLNSTLIHYMLA